MRRVDVTTLNRIGYGSFFVCFRLSRTKIVKVPSLYDCWPTKRMTKILSELGVPAEEWIVFDAIRGSRLPGALPVLELVEAVSPNRVRIGLVMPYAAPVGEEDVRRFVEIYPHWKWDARPDNYGRYRGEVVRTDTQLPDTDKLFTWI